MAEDSETQISIKPAISEKRQRLYDDLDNLRSQEGARKNLRAMMSAIDARRAKSVIAENDNSAVSMEGPESEKKFGNIKTIRVDGPDYMASEAAAIYDIHFPILCIINVEGSKDMWAVLKTNQDVKKSAHGEQSSFVLSVAQLVERAELEQRTDRVKNTGRHTRPLQHTASTHQGTEEHGSKFTVDTNSEEILEEGTRVLQIKYKAEDNSEPDIPVDLVVDENGKFLTISAGEGRSLDIDANLFSKID